MRLIGIVYHNPLENDLLFLDIRHCLLLTQNIVNFAKYTNILWYCIQLDLIRQLLNLFLLQDCNDIVCFLRDVWQVMMSARIFGFIWGSCTIAGISSYSDFLNCNNIENVLKDHYILILNLFKPLFFDSLLKCPTVYISICRCVHGSGSKSTISGLHFDTIG